MDIIILWVALSLIVAVIGKSRKIGFWVAFFLSIILTPVIGLVLALTSRKLINENKVNEHANSI